MTDRIDADRIDESARPGTARRSSSRSGAVCRSGSSSAAETTTGSSVSASSSASGCRAAARYVPQVDKEQTWLPRLAAPRSLCRSPRYAGSEGPPSRSRRLGRSTAGSRASRCRGAPGADPLRFAADLAAFLVALRSADASGGPAPGLHSAFRGGPVGHWDEEMHDLFHRVHGRERDLARGIWEDALAAQFTGPPVWFHGDVSVNNLLVQRGSLSAVIDFGCSAVGDPACDTTIVWTHFSGAAREVFRSELGLDDATWARGRGWALWKGLIMITNKPPGQAELARHVLDELFAGV